MGRCTFNANCLRNFTLLFDGISAEKFACNPINFHSYSICIVLDISLYVIVWIL